MLDPRLDMDDSLLQARDYVLREYGSKEYAYWTALIGQDPILMAHPIDANARIEVESVWDGGRPGGAIRVLISVYEITPRKFRVRVPTVSYLVFEDGRLNLFEHISKIDTEEGRK